MATSPRMIAVGDIHGCLAALDAVLNAVHPRPDDTLVTLGDYVDRGSDCCGALERLLALERQCRLIPLLGNHDDMMLNIIDGRTDWFENWLSFGGDATLQSYGVARPEDVPPEHIAFLRGCRLWHESERHFFLHGNYHAELPLSEQPPETILWDSIKTRLPGPHISGKTAIIGHASQKSGEILDLGYLKCIDTWCFGDGRLTALDVESGRVWQADKRGVLRK